MIGEPPKNVFDAILETLPIEFSVLDKDDKVLAWNKHETRIFKRPVGAVGRDVRRCHPPKSLAKVEQIISEMKKGERDKAVFWIDLPLGEKGEKHYQSSSQFLIKTTRYLLGTNMRLGFLKDQSARLGGMYANAIHLRV